MLSVDAHHVDKDVEATIEIFQYNFFWENFWNYLKSIEIDSSTWKKLDSLSKIGLDDLDEDSDIYDDSNDDWHNIVLAKYIDDTKNKNQVFDAMDVQEIFMDKLQSHKHSQ